MTKIVINGWYGHNNAGDDAILQIFIEQANANRHCDITVLSECPENIATTSRVRGAFHPSLGSFRGLASALINGDLLRHIRLIRQCDLVVVGGGGLLRDNTSWPNLIRLLDEIWLGRLFGRKVMLYAIGVGPFKTRLGKWLIAKSVMMCDLVTVRSERGAQLLREIGVPAARIHVVKDPAFLLPSAPSRDLALRALLARERTVGVFPAVSLVSNIEDLSHIRRLAAALDVLVERDRIQFVALPMRVTASGIDDVAVSKLIQAQMRHPDSMHIHEQQLAPSELKWATSQTLMNITVRLHAMIFSLGAGKPVVAVNYEPKVANVFAAFEVPDCMVEMDDTLDVALPAAVAHCLGNLDSYASKIERILPRQRTEAAQTFEMMESLCDRAATVKPARDSGVV